MFLNKFLLCFAFAVVLLLLLCVFFVIFFFVSLGMGRSIGGILDHFDWYLVVKWVVFFIYYIYNSSSFISTISLFKFSCFVKVLMFYL